MSKIWFPEPESLDATVGRPGESYWTWVNRSTLPRAQAARIFLNDSLAALQLPPDAERNLLGRLEAAWRPAFFEIIVGRTMQVLGGHLRFEVPTATGRRPDFVVSFPDVTVTVECVSPEHDRALKQQAKHWQRLTDAIEPYVPDGWSVWIQRLPYGIKPTDKITHFKRVVKAMLADIPPPDVDQKPYALQSTFDDEPIILSLMPRDPDDHPIRGGPAVAGFDTTVERIRGAVEEKRAQVRAAESPVVLAIEASGISSGWHHFDQALYGHPCIMSGDHDGTWVSGAFTGPQALRYAGVLAFLDVGFWAGPEPILYTNPRSEAPLPDAFRALTQKGFTARNGIHTTHAGTGGVYDAIGFVPPSRRR